MFCREVSPKVTPNLFLLFPQLEQNKVVYKNIKTPRPQAIGSKNKASFQEQRHDLRNYDEYDPTNLY